MVERVSQLRETTGKVPLWSPNETEPKTFQDSLSVKAPVATRQRWEEMCKDKACQVSLPPWSNEINPIEAACHTSAILFSSLQAPSPPTNPGQNQPIQRFRSASHSAQAQAIGFSLFHLPNTHARLEELPLDALLPIVPLASGLIIVKRAHLNLSASRYMLQLLSSRFILYLRFT
jgi:hypothetical protein